MQRRSPLLAFLCLASVSFAKETVYFKNGFSLEVDSCKQQGGSTILNTGSGTLEFSTDEISRIEMFVEPIVSQPPPLAAAPLVTSESLLANAAIAQGLDSLFIQSVAKVESGLRQDAVSRKGALGLMQLMPATAARLKVNASQADENALGGAKYLRELLLQYRGDSVLALAAYNAGPGAVEKFHGVPPYAETQRYIVLVLREYARQLSKQKSASFKLTQTKKPSATN
jgi:hypothetical protein